MYNWDSRSSLELEPDQMPGLSKDSFFDRLRAWVMQDLRSADADHSLSIFDHHRTSRDVVKSHSDHLQVDEAAALSLGQKLAAHAEEVKAAAEKVLSLALPIKFDSLEAEVSKCTFHGSPRGVENPCKCMAGC